MKKVNDIEQKEEVFRLWVKYLKMSDDYKEFSDWVVKKRKNSKLPVPAKFHKDEKTGAAPKEIFNYMTFGPVHDPGWTFEEWWEYHREKLTHRQNHRDPEAVEDYLKFIENDIDSCIDSFKRREGREPTLQEFKDHFLKVLKTRTFFSYFMIDNAKGKEVIEAVFKKMLKERKRDPLIKRLELSDRRRYLPSTNYCRMDELERHLRIYAQVKNGVDKGEILRKDPFYRAHITETGLNSTHERLYYMDIAKAKRIIRNVERGIFPGQYEK